MTDMPSTMNEKQAAQYIGLSQRTLQDYRFKSKPPAYIKVGRAVRYLREDLDTFLASHRVDPMESV